jgi:hypothetical protein
MTMFAMLLQTVKQAPQLKATRAAEWVDSMVAFLDTPAPFSPLTEYALVLLVLWLLARKKEPEPNFDEQAQEVLDGKFQRGELTKDAYDKHRQDMSLGAKSSKR